MIDIDFKINQESLKQITSDLDRFKALLDYQLFNKYRTRIFKVFMADSKRLFNSEGSSGAHGKWPELEPEYAAQKAKSYPGKKILERKGNLKNSLTKKSGNSIQIISNVNDGVQIKFGTTNEKAQYHNKGIPSKSGLKVRRPIDPSKQFIKEFHQEIQKAVRKELKSLKAFQMTEKVQIDSHMRSI